MTRYAIIDYCSRLEDYLVGLQVIEDFVDYTPIVIKLERKQKTFQVACKDIIYTIDDNKYKHKHKLYKP